MNEQTVSASLAIEQPPRRLYDILADYHDGHPRILPQPPFESLSVVRGGRGAGTIIEVWMRVWGRRESFRSVVSEPEPGRVLVETNDNGYVTTFTVDPQGPRSALVTISTDLSAGNGVGGMIQRLFARRLLGPVFHQQLEQLATLARAGAA
jgi:hypothetical protein